MTDFYKKYCELCAQKNVSASFVASAIGLSNAAATGWKKGKQPSDVTLAKLSDYFGVPVSELTGEQKETPSASFSEELNVANSVNRDPELTAYLEELRSRPEMRMLFSLAKDATKEDVEKAVAIIEALRRTEGK